MKRKRRVTFISLIFFSLGIFSFLLTLRTGLIITAAATPVFLILSFFLRKKESYLEYRSRYEQEFLRKDEPDDTPKEKNG